MVQIRDLNDEVTVVRRHGLVPSVYDHYERSMQVSTFVRQRKNPCRGRLIGPSLCRGSTMIEDRIRYSHAPTMPSVYCVSASVLAPCQYTPKTKFCGKGCSTHGRATKCYRSSCQTAVKIV